MKHFEKTFAKELTYYYEKDRTPLQQWIVFLEDLANYADYYWDIPKMQYDLVKSKKEWEEFTSHPDRKPYKLAVTEWVKLPIEELYEKVLDVVKETVELMEEKSVGAQDKRSLLRALESIVKGIVHSRYELTEMRLTDTYVGISMQDRDNAKLVTTQVQKAKFEYVTEVIALQTGKTPTEIRQKFRSICENDISRIGEFFSTCQFDDELKDLYTKYRDISASNKTFADLNIILGYKIWQELHAHGITLEKYMELLDYPSPKQVEKKMLDFLKNSEVNAEILNHLKDEFPLSYKKYKKQGYIDLIDVSQEEGHVHNFPKKLRTEKETQSMVSEFRSIMSEYFPISKEESTRYIMFSPTHPFSVRRAYQSRTYNSEKLPVNLVVTTPLVDSREDYLRTLAHETTHSIHQMILIRGVEYHAISKAQADQVPTGVLEDFSQLVEGQFGEETKDGAPAKKYKGKLFSSFYQSLGSRWQAPFSLIQLQIRTKFEEWIKSGVKVVTQEMLTSLHIEFDTKLTEWWETDIVFRRRDVSGLSWFEPLAPYDGLVYMKRFISQPEKPQKISTKSTQKTLDMGEAFVKRFGQSWIKNADARALLYWLLLETGRNHETEKFGKLILEKNIRECLEELQKIGIDASEFSAIE